MYVPKEAEAQKKRQSLNNKDLKDFNLMLYYDDVKYNYVYNIYDGNFSHTFDIQGV